MLASVEPACQTILYQVRSQVNSNSQGSFISRIQKISSAGIVLSFKFLFRLLECMGDMRKGSPHDYTTRSLVVRRDRNFVGNAAGTH